MDYMHQEKRYSSMTEHELRQEIAKLLEMARKAEQMGMVSEYAVLERKAVMAKAYLLVLLLLNQGKFMNLKVTLDNILKLTI